MMISHSSLSRQNYMGVTVLMILLLYTTVYNWWVNAFLNSVQNGTMRSYKVKNA